ncbi:polyprenyl synthetase family protein [soil metagenome]
MSLFTSFQEYYHRINQQLDSLLTNSDIEPASLAKAMQYTITNGGKRIRPLLVYATGAAFGADLSRLDHAACAIELIHTYSLVHDDLPAMDNAQLRRGKPTCHIAFDEATAILVGDALQVLAFEILTRDVHKPLQQLKMLAHLAKACGVLGMVAGQALDLQMNQHTPTLAELDAMYLKKTGALIISSVQLGALAAGIDKVEQLDKLAEFAKLLGLAYQIQDDILDIEACTATLGKQQGIDQINNKITYPNLIGLNAAKIRVDELFSAALNIVTNFGSEALQLQRLARMLLQREY